MKKVAIIGGGKVGKTLGRLLRKAGYKILGVVNRSIESAKKAVTFIGDGKPFRQNKIAVGDADIVLLTTPDDVIKKTCDGISKGKGFRRGAIVLHCCGSTSSYELLESARKSGAYIASLHPLRSFADPSTAIKNFKGTFCVYEGDKKATPIVKKIIRDIGGVSLQSKADRKALYHSGAVFGSNYVVALFHIGVSLFEATGISHKDATASLLYLLEGTIGNIKKVGVTKALTGPIERGDISNIERHLETLDIHNSQLAKIYSLLGSIAVDIAIKKGSITNRKGVKLKKLLKKFAK
ncbi:MAG: hypothetical protein A2W05_11650 [Candidatus Schekmanbacteria bacterium RBG_16_38_10]|uniref:DUF2520 domain-containing protein n=1 Tax=Candidatus Schekmanbacteria bacterium RBG_16_38_10 TaxID=1817879 RepID=A0A1F7RWY8_9BACT|nr:MAG: hypothetical protein A2W05_11650 [Candidatus Schekmanbacteria bacterium RBG_16_38_10]